MQEQYGCRDPYIERELLAPHFYPHARAGEIERGLRVLVAQVDRWITDRDREMARRREEVASREVRLRAVARDSLESAGPSGMRPAGRSTSGRSRAWTWGRWNPDPGTPRATSTRPARGSIMAEEGADPGPRLDESRRLVESAATALQAGDPEATGAQLDDARGALAAAVAQGDRHLAARVSVARDREDSRGAEARLDRAVSEAARIVGELEVSFAPESWRSVAGNLDAATALRDQARERLAAADRAASDEVQAYIQAAGLVTDAAGRSLPPGRRRGPDPPLPEPRRRGLGRLPRIR